MKHCRDSSELGLFKVVQKGNRKNVTTRSGLAIAALLVITVLLYLTIFFTGNNRIENTTNSTGLQKELHQAPSLSEDNAQISHPKPFRVEFSGPPPRRFTPTPPTTTPTIKKATTLIYPQLTNYRNRYYPRNIQDILKHMKNEPNHQAQKYARDTETKRANNPQQINPFTSDIFQRYKPKDPSEVNLLATGRVRFAPPVWKDFRRFEGEKINHQPPFVPTITQIRNPQRHSIPLNASFAENVPIVLTNENQMTNIVNQFVKLRGKAKKPMTITLNLYPMGNRYVTRDDLESSASISHQLADGSNKMTIDLGVTNLD